MRSATTEIEHNYMLACALQARLLAGSAASGEIAQPELAGVVELALGHGVHSVAVAALWFVARYAVAVDRDSARRWLALGERISRELDTAPSLEEVLRDETMAALEITNLATLVAAAPAFDPTTALDQAAAWVASRSPSEIAPRDHVARISLRLLNPHDRLRGRDRNRASAVGCVRLRDRSRHAGELADEHRLAAVPEAPAAAGGRIPRT